MRHATKAGSRTTFSASSRPFPPDPPMTPQIPPVPGSPLPTILASWPCAPGRTQHDWRSTGSKWVDECNACNLRVRWHVEGVQTTRLVTSCAHLKFHPYGERFAGWCNCGWRRCSACHKCGRHCGCRRRGPGAWHEVRRGQGLLQCPACRGGGRGRVSRARLEGRPAWQCMDCQHRFEVKKDV